MHGVILSEPGGIPMISYDHDEATVDGLTFRKDKATGYYLSSKEIDGRRKRLHIYMWERENGPVPKGFQIHHADFNKDNNEPENLVCLTEHDHQSLHMDKRKKEHPELLERFQKAGIAGAPKWHASKDGHDWHKKHYESMKDRLYEKHEEVCANCGKPVFTSAYKERYFCSNNCKSAFRRKSGVDNEERTCVICGATFTAGKYSKQQTCSRECGTIKAVQSKKRKA